MGKPAKLARTPRPKSLESLRGYLLRLNEVNGYHSPQVLLRLAGADERAARQLLVQTDILSSLSGFSDTDIEKTLYEAPRRGRRHVMRSTQAIDIKRNHFSLAAARVCPLCIRETGYVDFFWDLRIAIACPHHDVFAVTRCEKCRRHVCWNRPGLLTCHCGATFSVELPSKSCSHHLRSLMLVLWAKLRDASLPTLDLSPSRLPIPELEAMSLQTLLALSDRFGRAFANLSLAELADCRDPHERMATVTALALCNWPNGLFHLLDAYQAQTAVLTKATKARKRKTHALRRLQSSLFKSDIAADEIGFLVRIIAQYQAARWRQSASDSRIIRKAGLASATMIGVTQCARQLGVHPATLRRMAENGMVETAGRDHNDRLVFDSSVVMRKRIAGGNTVAIREAARALGIPVAVLPSLRDLSVFKQRYVGSKLASFHEYDVEEFRQRLLNAPEKNAPIAADRAISLSACMKMKTGSPARKAAIIKAILDQTLSMHRFGETVGDILLDKFEVQELVRGAAVNETDSLLIVEVARSLDCDPTVVEWLVQQGHLVEHRTANARRITRATRDAFAQLYVSCCYIAKANRTSARKVVALCIQKQLPLLVAQRKNKTSAQAFLKRSDQAVLGLSAV